MLAAVNVAKDLDFHGEALTILRCVNLMLNKGESVAIVGSSGSGKSTLLSILAGLDYPSSGEVWLLGKPLFTLTEDERALLRRNQIGFVFQNFQLFPPFTALENVMFPLELAGLRDAREVALAMLERVGLSHRVNHYPRHLSGGEQQRVALARAFVIQPRLLFADEPTGSLDRQNGMQITDLLFRLNEEAGTSLVLITHDANLASRCNTICRLVDGQLGSKR